MVTQESLDTIEYLNSQIKNSLYSIHDLIGKNGELDCLMRKERFRYFRFLVDSLEIEYNRIAEGKA